MDDFFTLLYLRSKNRIAAEIVKQSRAFDLEKYFNGEFISEDDEINWERKNTKAAYIRITRKNRYNIFVYTNHAVADNRLDYVLYDDIEYKYKTLEELNNSVVEQLEDTFFNNIKRGNVLMHLDDNKIYMWLPVEKNLFQKSELEKIANELIIISQKKSEKIELYVNEYMIVDGRLEENPIGDYSNEGHQFNDFLDYVKEIKPKAILNIPKEEDLFKEVNTVDGHAVVDRF